MTQRQFLRADDWALIEPSDLPSLEGLLGVLTVLQGGTGLDYIGPNNTFLASTGFETRWRKLTDLMIQPEYRTGSGPSILTATIASLTDGDMLVYVAATDSWENVAVPVGGAHDILSATHTDSLASAVSRGSIIVGNSTPKWAELNLGAAGTILRSDGTDLAYTTATYPATTTANRILYSSADNVIGQIASAASGVLVTDGSSVPSIATDIPTAVTIGGAYIYRVGGTDVSLLDGGTGASLTASNGGIFYSTAAAGAILAGTATARQMLQSGASTTPAWSTTTWPATTTANRILYSSATSVIGEITSANSAVLVTDASGVPALSATMTDGQVIIGDTSGTPVAASITDDDDILITAGAGTLDIRRVAETGYWLLPSPYPQTVTTQAMAAGNEVRALLFYLPCRLKVNSIHYSLNSNASANSVSVGIYDQPGTTKLIQSTVITSGAGTKSTTLGAEVDLSPGYYWAAYTASGTSATFRTVSLGTNAINVVNAGTAQNILASNASAAGVLPTTLGTITTADAISSFPYIKLQN